MSTRIRNPRGEGERLRTALLDAATDLLGESQDVERLSVRGVTARAGVSPTALYLQFTDKEDLTRAVKARCFAALGETLRKAESEHDGDPREQLRALGRAYLRFAREQPGQYAILFQTRIPEAGPAHGSDAFGEEPGHEVFDILVQAVARCLRDDADPFEISCLLWMTLHGRAAMRSAMPDFPFPDDERYVALLLDRCIGADA
jgi:AcrR family transcriptional regulator